MASPLFPQVGVIGLVPDRSDALWQTRHQVLRRLAEFFRVAWVEPASGWRQALSPRPGADAGTAGNGMTYQAPRYLPVVHRPETLGRWLERGRLQQVRGQLAARGARRVVLYLWRPSFAGALASPHELSIYHIDDEYSFDSTAVGLTRSEADLIRRVDQVFVHSPRLLDLKGRLNPHTEQIPNGVDFARFASLHAEPADLANVPRPRIGYAGYLKPHLDWGLLDALAARNPEASFVMVGPDRQLVAAPESYQLYRARPNVYFLGEKPSATFASYHGHFDVALLPYLRDDYTDCIYPLKLHEYLAAGKAVVGTPIRSLQDFGKVITLAASLEDWQAGLRDALKPEAMSPASVIARQEVARAHDWWTLVGRLATTIANRLGLPNVDRIVEHAAARVGGPAPLGIR